MKKRKGFKSKKHNQIKGSNGEFMEYKTYEEALKNRRSDEITIYDQVKKVYKNVKIYPRRRGRIFFTW